MSVSVGCQERRGFLFSHACSNPAIQTCVTCGKEICQVHGHATAEGICCTTCAGGAFQANPGQAQPFSRFSDNLFFGYGYRRHGFSSGWRDDDDFNDFTHADGENLRAEGDDPFEQDMGGS